MKYNYKYGKLLNEAIEYAPTVITLNGRMIFNPKTDMLLELGYKPIVDDGHPNDDNVYTSTFIENDNNIIKTYTKVEENNTETEYDEITQLELALAEEYEKNIEAEKKIAELSNSVTDLELAIAELYESTNK